MEYRSMDKLGVKPSMLGFGCMRFPQKEDGSIDEVESEKMLDKAIEAGVTYIDTAYPYHNGESEPFVGRVLKKYKRDSFYLATKLPIWKVETIEDVKATFEEQLNRLQVDYVDFYLLHALSKERWEKILKLGVLDFCKEMKEQGKLKYIGFSFHDSYEVFEEILTSWDWDFCQIQYNYMDTEHQAGDRGYALAEKLGVPMVIMEPIKGGSLAVLPEDIAAMYKEADQEASISSWALRWVGTHSNVKVILSGMSTYSQVLDNLKTFETFKPLNQEEQALVKKVAATIRSRVKNGCTGCRYCMPCPFGIDIPKNFAIWNQEAMYGNPAAAKRKYERELAESARADQCRKCGACEKECPQAISIREDLVRVKEDFAKMQ
ncbi:MAG: aldo/keto reductase [Lachnospiraceae bacterium]|nr:aldo/keto reductase [Lachnospiraceae bacterium]